MASFFTWIGIQCVAMLFLIISVKYTACHL